VLFRPARALEFDLAVESPVGQQRAETGEIARSARMRREFVEEVEGVDRRGLGPVCIHWMVERPGLF
jgi:hypothetical protein